MSDHPADIHDGQDPEPADGPAPIEPGHIVELADYSYSWPGAQYEIPSTARGTVTATTDRTALVRIVVPVTFEVLLSDLRRCD